MSKPVIDYTITSQKTLISIVEALGREPLAGVTVKSLADDLDRSRDAVFRTLKNLEAAGWARQSATDAWSLDVAITLVSERLRQALAEAHRTYLLGERNDQ